MQINDYFYSLITDKRNDFIACVLKIILLVCSFVYSLLIRISYVYSIFLRYRPRCKVIRVGNITWGGTGKTPMVEILARFLKEQGRNVAILSRGYRSDKSQGEPKDKNADTLGDESYLLTKKLPDTHILVGKNRIKNAKKAVREYNVDTIILDDGFQHWRMFRDLDIVMIDSMNPFGNENIIPRGILREPLRHLRHAQIFVLTKTDLQSGGLSYLKDRLSKINPEAVILESIHRPMRFYNLTNSELPLSYIKDRNVCLVSSVASPESFEKTVENLDAKIALKFFFPDHHKYNDSDIENIRDNCKRLNIDCIVTTEKDAVKLESIHNIQNLLPGLIILQIKLEIIQNKVFYDRLLSVYTS